MTHIKFGFTFCFMAFTLSVKATDQITTYFSSIDLHQVFGLSAARDGGIIADVTDGGQVDVSVYLDDPSALNRKGVLIYEIFSTTTSQNFQGQAKTYNRSDLGPGAAYYPSVWTSTNIPAATLGVNLEKYHSSTSVYADQPFFMPFNGTQAVIIEVTTTQATFHSAKVPGIGIVDESTIGTLFKPTHACSDEANKDTEPCRTWIKVKQPDLAANADLIVALHRGRWGFDLGAGYPENSELALEATTQFSQIAETDITITRDNQLVVSHDFSLKRISDFSGDDSYTFTKTLSELQELNLKRRNGTVSTSHYLSFAQLMNLALEHQILIMVDIKSLQPKIENGQCVLNCEYSDPQKQKESWLEIFELCMNTVFASNAAPYVTFKTPYSFDDLKTQALESQLQQVLFMPVIQPQRRDYISFVEDWHLNGGRSVLAYETNFLNADHPFLHPFTKDGVTYDNLLHYVYEITRLRGGSFSPEPNGPRGVSFRWNNWFMKSPTDFRGDPLNLLNVPFGQIQLITTDRPEIWTDINTKLNQ